MAEMRSDAERIERGKQPQSIAEARAFNDSNEKPATRTPARESYNAKRDMKRYTNQMTVQRQ
jgi:hypothetical protein